MRSPQISDPFGKETLISTAALIRVNTALSGITISIKPRSQMRAIFLEKKITKRRGANSRKFGTFPYAPWNLTFTRTCFYK